MRFASDHLKTKKMRKHTVKKLHFLIKYVPNEIWRNIKICS